MTDSNLSQAAGKLSRPTKPYKTFPLGAAPNGKWQKKVKGQLHFFGRWFRTVDGVQVREPDDGATAALEACKA
jgi:hypothetical protein